ncbi:MAG TPA: hypothetical protein VFD84_06165 [Candidatus Binatia bacterium]|nr:hypothetical protein [Candidatus Binatia bacterium]
MPDRLAALLAAALACATPAAAHNVPVLPSQCALEPFTVTAVGGPSATVAAPDAGDLVRTVYDLQSETAQFTSPAAAPRAFDVGGVPATVTVPPLFTAMLFTTADHASTTGEIVVPSFPLAVGMAGDAETVPFTLTTGLVAAGGRVFAGTPLDATGHYTLVGVAPATALPPPLGGAPLVVSLGCQAVPPPDVHQFQRSLDSALLGGRISKKTFSVRTLFAPAPNLAPDFAGKPALFRAAAGDVTVAAGAFPGGLARRTKKLWVSTSPDRSVAIGVRFLHHRFDVDDYLLAVKIKAPALPAAAGKRTPIALTYELGGLIGRAGGGFRTNRKRTVFTFH